MNSEKSAERPKITGMAAVSALGDDWTTTWRALLAGEINHSSYQTIDGRFEMDELVAAVEPRARSISESGEGPAARLALAVLSQLGQAGKPTRIFGGSNHGETDLLLRALVEGASALQWLALMFDSLPSSCGPSVHWSYAACASGLHALCAATQHVKESGEAAVVLGVDALSAIGISGFKRMGATSATGSHPFDLERDGLLIGEGAAALRLVPASQEGDGSIQILGFGMSCDAGHPTDPDPEGYWLGLAIDQALANSGVRPGNVAAIISHGTGTPKNDLAEMKAVAARWPSRTVPVTSIKRGIGHTMGAAGLFNILAAVETCNAGLVPPTSIALGNRFAELDVVCGAPRAVPRGGPVMVIASGFGGNNVVCLVGAEV